MKKIRYFLEAVGTMIGTIIGAGVLGIPYAVAHAGFWTGIIDIAILGVIVMILYLYLGEIILRTKRFHQLTGYAEKYLGSAGKKWMAFAMIFGTYGALIAYLIGEGEAMLALFGVGNPVVYTIAFFLVASTIVYFGIQFVADSDIFGMVFALIAIAVVILFSLPSINSSNYTAFSFKSILAPYGVILFAFLGASAVPEIGKVLQDNKNMMKKSIITGLAVPIILYILFAFAAVGVTGIETTEVATIGLGKVLGETMVILGNIFAVFAMATSFITLGLALKDMYEYDLKMEHNLAWALTCFPPLAIALSGMTGFVRVIGLAGIISGGIEGILIVLMFRNAKRKGDRNPEYKIKANGILSMLLIFLFVLGVIHYFAVSL